MIRLKRFHGEPAGRWFCAAARRPTPTPESFTELVGDTHRRENGDPGLRYAHESNLEPVECITTATSEPDRARLHSEQRDCRSADRGFQTPRFGACGQSWDRDPV